MSDESFNAWWDADGSYYDPDTDDVSWFDKRKELAQYARMRLQEQVDRLAAEPIPMLLWCPDCRARHIDVGEFATKPHHTHACQNCGMVWRPAIGATVGVQFLPGFKNAEIERREREG